MKEFFGLIMDSGHKSTYWFQYNPTTADFELMNGKQTLVCEGENFVIENDSEILGLRKIYRIKG